MVAGVLLQLPAPILTMYIVDSAVDGASTEWITKLALVFLGLILLRSALSFVSERATLQLKETVIQEIGANLIQHLHRLPSGFFANRHSTYLQSRVMSDSRAIEGALARTLVNVVINGLTFLVGLGFVLYIRYQLALLLLSFLAVFAFIRYYANDRMRALSQQMQEIQASTSAAVSESFAGVRTVKVFGREEAQSGRLRDRLGTLRDIYVNTNWFAILAGLGTGTITSICAAFVLWYGARAVLAGEMTLGEVVAVLTFLSFLYTPINSLVAANLSIHQSAAAIQRIYEFLEEVPERREGLQLDTVQGRIEARGLAFAYPGGDPVLDDVDLAIEPGTKVALVGKSGAGKSTLVNLLVRFYEHQEGELLLDGHDVRKLSLYTLRNTIGIVDQQTFLFTGTIAENIRFGRPEASSEEVREAARKAFAHDFIERLPEGYESLVGERGVRLSGGQAQRIALARMFLKDPKILILDEAVSAVDSESEAFIKRALQPLTVGRTTIIIAHRLSSLLMAEQVLLLEDGKVVECGSHRQLMDRDSRYAQLFREQFRPQLDEGASPPDAIVA
jgi:ABC-type multidrug transport system fused ATPase/permease subunit